MSRRFTPSLALATLVAVLFLNSPAASQQTRQYPDTIAHAKSFLKLRPGIPRKLFRVLVPPHWRPAPRMFSHKQNVNPRGEVNLGYFEYHFEARGTYQPVSWFTFWDEVIASASMVSTSDDFEKSKSFLRDADRILPIIIREYGVPKVSKRTARDRKFVWETNTFSITLRAYLPNLSDAQSLGALSIDMANKKAAKKARRFSGRFPKSPKGTGPLAVLLCSKQAPSGARRWLEIGVIIDTRKLGKKVANLVATHKKNAFMNLGYKCSLSVSVNGSMERSLERAAANRPVLKTYLRFKDSDGLLNIINFPNSSVPVEDKLCEAFRKSLSAKALSPVCVTGTEVWQRPPG